MSKVAVISDIHLLPDGEERVRELSGGSFEFPHEDTIPSTNEIIKRTGDAEAVLISPSVHVTEDYLAACPNVKYIGICGTSKENVDITAVAARNITLTNVVDYGDEPAAEFIFMQLELLARGMGEYRWRKDPVELMGESIGIIGLGALGKAVARLALAYKMKVYYYSKTRKPDQERLGLTYLEKDELLSRSEIIVVSTPSNLVALDKTEFELVAPNSIIVQVSMGECLDRESFKEWIGQDSNFAIFDYSAGEKSYEEYKDLPRVIFPKVVAGHTLETKQRLGEKVVSNLKSYLMHSS